MDDAIERVEALRAQIGHKQAKIEPRNVHPKAASNDDLLQ
jgi:hypothetical protein